MLDIILVILAAVAVVLLIIVLGINFLTRYLTQRFDVTRLK